MAAESEMTGPQCRAARLLLAWTESELAERAGIAVLQVIRFEAGRKASRSDAATSLRRALEEAGIRFKDTDVELKRLSQGGGR